MGFWNFDRVVLARLDAIERKLDLLLKNQTGRLSPEDQSKINRIYDVAKSATGKMSDVTQKK